MLIRTLVGHPWPPGTLAASPSAGCGECVLSDLLFTKEAAMGGQVKPPAPFQTFQPPGADELLCEETAEACA